MCKIMVYVYPAKGLVSIDHQIGFVVLTQTSLSSGTRWFDVETNPSNDDSSLSSIMIRQDDSDA